MLSSTDCLANHLPDDKPISSIKDLDNARLLPSISDHSCQRLDYKTLVQRVLTNSLQCFESLKGEVTIHIPTPYSYVMSKKTEKVISSKLGIFSLHDNRHFHMIVIVDNVLTFPE